MVSETWPTSQGSSAMPEQAVIHGRQDGRVPKTHTDKLFFVYLLPVVEIGSSQL